jgi:hypothetical protein
MEPFFTIIRRPYPHKCSLTESVCLVIHKESGLFVESKITSISGLNGSDSIRFYLQTNMSSLWGLSELFFLMFSPFNLVPNGI